jgi:hypothetical protein
MGAARFTRRNWRGVPWPRLASTDEVSFNTLCGVRERERHQFVALQHFGRMRSDKTRKRLKAIVRNAAVSAPARGNSTPRLHVDLPAVYALSTVRSAQYICPPPCSPDKRWWRRRRRQRQA